MVFKSFNSMIFGEVKMVPVCVACCPLPGVFAHLFVLMCFMLAILQAQFQKKLGHRVKCK